MIISHSQNIIETRDEIKVVPISNSLDNLDTVRNIIQKIVRNEKNHGRILSVAGYFLNDDKTKVMIGSNTINNVVCPYRNLSRKI